MRFITGHSRTEQLDEPGLWKTLDNQLFKDNDGSIYLVPRNFKTDGFTIPNWIAWIGGGKMQWDTRCSSQHDLECRYAQVIRVKASEQFLRRVGLVRVHKDKVVCEDIPRILLEIQNVTFTQANDRFARMLTLTNIPKWRIKPMRLAVNLNPNWHSCKYPLNLKDIYHTVI